MGEKIKHSGSGKDVFESIVTYCSENQIDLANLNIIGCDGTAVNTGSNSGVISCMENYLERPLQHIICLLHLNLVKRCIQRNWFYLHPENILLSMLID